MEEIKKNIINYLNEINKLEKASITIKDMGNSLEYEVVIKDKDGYRQEHSSVVKNRESYEESKYHLKELIRIHNN